MHFTQQLYSVFLFSEFQPSVETKYIKKITVWSKWEWSKANIEYRWNICLSCSCICLFVCSLFHCSGCYAGCQKHSIHDITKTCLYSHSQFRIIPLCEFYQNLFTIMKQFTSFVGEAKYSDLYLESNLALSAVRLSADDHCTTHSFRGPIFNGT